MATTRPDPIAQPGPGDPAGLARMLVESIDDPFFALDRAGRFTYVNDRAAEHFRRSAGELLGRAFLELFPEFTSDLPIFQEVMAACCSRTFEHFTPGRDLWQEVRVFPCADGVSVLLRDVTGSKRDEQKILELAFYDRLTGLANRTLLQNRLASAIQGKRRGEERFAVLFLDLDGFKEVNDSLGHKAGDEVLVAVAKRLEASVRDGDTAARLGGDEFVLLMKGLDHPETIHSVAHRVLLELTRELEVQGTVLTVTASVGISFFPDNGDTAEDLLKAADTAMYWAKNEGPNGYRIFDRERADRSRRPGGWSRTDART